MEIIVNCIFDLLNHCSVTLTFMAKSGNAHQPFSLRRRQSQQTDYTGDFLTRPAALQPLQRRLQAFILSRSNRWATVKTHLRSNNSQVRNADKAPETFVSGAPSAQTSQWHHNDLLHTACNYTQNASRTVSDA